MNTNMNLQRISVDRLKPAKYNPRKDLKPGDPAYEKIKRSLHEFGYVDPVIWNEVTGNIVGGHQRYKVLTAEGATEIDCVVVHMFSRSCMGARTRAMMKRTTTQRRKTEMAVKVGSARIDEKGRAHGGKAGNQTGKELSVQNWYRHSKGWRVLRCMDSSKAEKIAAAMEAACRNRNIGYDQYERLTLYNLAKAVGFDPARVANPCETDCSALVRVCLAFAGIATENFRTPTQAKVMLATGQFVELTGKQYTDSSDYLRRGDVLVTRAQGHTVVVLSNGSKADASEAEHQLGDRLLKKGMSGSDVRKLQQNLLKLGHALPKYGADGDYGAETVDAVRAFQKKSGLETDGIYGSNTHNSLTAALEALKEPKPVLTTAVILSTEDGSVNVRTGNGTQYAILRSARAGDTLNYVATAVNGWNAVEIDNQVGWVSGKYSKII